MKTRLWAGLVALVLGGVIVSRVGFNFSLIVSMLSVPAAFYWLAQTIFVAAPKNQLLCALVSLSFAALACSYSWPKMVIVSVAFGMMAIGLDYKRHRYVNIKE